MSTRPEDVLDFIEQIERGLKILEPSLPSTPISTPVEPPKKANPLELECLTKIEETQQNIKRVRESLNSIIDAVASDASVLTQVAEYWGTKPTWLKAAGAGIVLPPALIGVAASIGSLIAIGGAASVVYFGAGALLEDHYKCNENMKQKLELGIGSLANILEISIMALSKISLELNLELNKFKTENMKLSTHVQELELQTRNLTLEINMLIQTDKYIREEREKLEASVHELEKINSDKKVEIQKMKNTIASFSAEAKINQDKLLHQITELQKTRDKLTAEVIESEKTTSELKQTVGVLTKAINEEKKERDELQGKLSKIKDSMDTAKTVTDQLTVANKEFDGARHDLQENNKKYFDLLKTQKNILDRQSKFLSQLDKMERVVQLRQQATRKDVGQLRRSIFQSPIDVDDVHLRMDNQISVR